MGPKIEYYPKIEIIYFIEYSELVKVIFQFFKNIEGDVPDVKEPSGIVMDSQTPIFSPLRQKKTRVC